MLKTGNREMGRFDIVWLFYFYFCIGVDVSLFLFTTVPFGRSYGVVYSILRMGDVGENRCGVIR